MRQAVLAGFTLFCVALGAAGAWAQEEVGEGVGLGFIWSPALEFLDVDQFAEDFDRIELPKFPTSQFGSSLNVFLDVMPDYNVFRLGIHSAWFHRQENHQGRFVELNNNRAGALLGYKRLFGSHFGLLVDCALGFGTWEYDVHSPDLQGHIYNSYFYVEPEIGFELIARHFGLGVTGSYFTEAASVGALYSADFSRDEYGDLDLSHFTLKLNLIFGIWSRGEKPQAVEPEPPMEPQPLPPDENVPSEPAEPETETAPENRQEPAAEPPAEETPAEEAPGEEGEPAPAPNEEPSAAKPEGEPAPAPEEEPPAE